MTLIVRTFTQVISRFLQIKHKLYPSSAHTYNPLILGCTPSQMSPVDSAGKIYLAVGAHRKINETMSALLCVYFFLFSIQNCGNITVVELEKKLECPSHEKKPEFISDNVKISLV